MMLENLAIEMLICIPAIPVVLILTFICFLLACIVKLSNLTTAIHCRPSTFSSFVAEKLNEQLTFGVSFELFVSYFVHLFVPSQPLKIFHTFYHNNVAVRATCVSPIYLHRKLVLVFLTVEEQPVAKYLIRTICEWKEIGFIELHFSQYTTNPKYLKRVMEDLRALYNFAYFGAFAIGPEAAMLLEYLSDVGAASRIQCAVIADPDFGDNTSFSSQNTTTESQYSTSSFRQRTNTTKRISFSSSLSIDQELVEYGLPENLDDISVPVLWLQTKQVPVPYQLFENSLHFLFMEGSCLTQIGDISTTFFNAVIEFMSKKIN